MIESNTKADENVLNDEGASANGNDAAPNDKGDVAEGETIEEILVPEGVFGGEPMEIKVRDGRRMSFTFPEGVEAGQLLHIVIPSDDE